MVDLQSILKLNGRRDEVKAYSTLDGVDLYASAPFFQDFIDILVKYSPPISFEVTDKVKLKKSVNDFVKIIDCGNCNQYHEETLRSKNPKNENELYVRHITPKDSKIENLDDKVNLIDLNYRNFKPLSNYSAVFNLDSGESRVCIFLDSDRANKSIRDLPKENISLASIGLKPGYRGQFNGLNPELGVLNNPKIHIENLVKSYMGFE